jgi:trk system potassium uptake protein TrkH
MNFKFIFNVFGRVLILLGLFMLTNIICALVYQEETILPLLFSAFITIASGALMYFATLRNLKKELGLKGSYFTVTFTWIIISVYGTLPYLLTCTMVSFNDALFEAVSGFTTTGSSIIPNVEILPKSILYWRSLTHWIGGMGIIVLVVAILPLLRISGYNLFKNEASAISYEKLTPKTASTAKRLWAIYVSLTFILTGLLMLGNMNFFDALNHAFSTMSTGGFSTKNSGIGGYNAYIQYVIMLFMILAGANFYLHYHFLKGRFKKVFSNIELRSYLGIMLVAALLIAFIIHRNGGLTYEKALRDAFFQVVSIISTTGYFTTDYLLWPLPAWTILFLLMFIGACVGSTGGGIKVIRHVVSFRNVVLHFQRMLHPNSVSLLKINNEVVDDEQVGSLISFLVLYLLTFTLGAVLMVFLGHDTLTSVGAVAANMGGVGPGIGSVGPANTYADIHESGKALLSVLMIIGRLELTTVLILFSGLFWQR